MSRIQPFALILMLSMAIFSCSKNTDNPQRGEPDNPASFPGEIYYEQADDGIIKLDMSTNVKSVLFPSDIYRYSWDLSRDSKRMLTTSQAVDHDYDANVYTYINVADGTIIKQFKYYPTEGDITSALLSFDEKFIAVKPTYDDGIVIMDINGKLLYVLDAVNGIKIRDEDICWMPDNTILFRVKNKLYRTSSDFKQADLIKEMPFNDWRSFVTNADGSKISFYASNHIWLMNADGSNMVQVTESSGVEAAPEFSPDGKFLVIGNDYHVTGPFGHLSYLFIIPADGKKYNVDEGKDNRVTPVIARQEKDPEICGGNKLWR
jgi:Tol biopolymer transport system component